jgi:mono/diheme cytochrome c family protein
MLNLPAETDAIAAALEMFASTAASMPAARQVQVVQVLAESRDARVPAALLKLAGSDAEPYVRIAALAALGAFDDPGLAAQIIEIYPGLGDRGLRHAAIGVLASRPAWSMALLGAVQAGTIRREDVPAERLDVLRGSSDPAVLSRLEEVFGKPARATTAEKQQEIERLAAVITSGTGDAAVGKPLFAALCARCHILHGHGLDIGPDLSIAKRDDVRELLLSIVDPSAGIHEDYTAYSFTLKLRDLSGAETAVAAADIRSEQALPASIMPEGLLSALTDQQIRDLTAYVMSKSEPAPK